jgi:hypothetical protein
MNHPAYIVLAHRWGDEDGHTYLVGWAYTRRASRRMADAERDMRGGKYAGVVFETQPGPNGKRAEVYRAKSMAE